MKAEKCWLLSLWEVWKCDFLTSVRQLVPISNLGRCGWRRTQVRTGFAVKPAHCSSLPGPEGGRRAQRCGHCSVMRAGWHFAKPNLKPFAPRRCGHLLLAAARVRRRFIIRWRRHRPFIAEQVMHEIPPAVHSANESRGVIWKTGAELHRYSNCSVRRWIHPTALCVGWIVIGGLWTDWQVNRLTKPWNTLIYTSKYVNDLFRLRLFCHWQTVATWGHVECGFMNSGYLKEFKNTYTSSPKGLCKWDCRALLIQ